MATRPARTGKKPRKASAAQPTTIAVEMRDSIALLVMSRPEVHNAFNAALIRDMTDALIELDRDDSVRAGHELLRRRGSQLDA